MPNSSRLAKRAFSTKPRGLPLDSFQLSPSDLRDIAAPIHADALDDAYAAAVTYAEAVSALRQSLISWSVIRLYYTAFYCVRSLCFISKVVPFNNRGEFVLDAALNNFYKGGASTHKWNWNAFRRIPSLNTLWPFSTDSADAYGALRQHREDVNYRSCFPDPGLHSCLVAPETDVGRRFRSYRDDDDFFYTYLPEHLALAYPTKLLVFLDEELSKRDLTQSEERRRHLRSIWALKDRCPIT